LRPKLKLRKTRSVHVTIATITLAVPASAVALTGAVVPGQSSDTAAAAPAGSVHLKSTPRRIRYGRPITVSGRAPRSAAGQTIELQTVTSGSSSWRPLKAGRIGPHGGFRLRARLRRSGLIRVVPAPAAVAATAGSTGGPGAAQIPASAPRPVSVAADVRVHPRSVDLLGGGAVNVRGRLLSERAGRRVRLQDHYPTGWHTLASSRTGPAGGFRLRATPASGLDRRLRVLFAGDRINSRTTRPAGRVTVYGNQSVASWYDDSGSTACGFHAGLGVANRSLPCGTKVRFHYGGRSVTAVVDDRGPYVGGREWDLNQNTAAALGFAGVGSVWTAQ
jgi:rare lipoprotein A